MATVGVLCARVRVEEKQLMAALAEAGAASTPLPPADVPLPIGPPPSSPAPSETPFSPVGIVVDRCQDRVAAAAILTACRALGALTLDAGLAATGDRLAVATALAAAGLPRPRTRLACSPEAALAAFAELGYPGTLLPLTAGAAPVVLLDADVAEAVLEHRAVLGAPREALALVQAGAPEAAARTTVVVVDGRAVATVGEAAALPPAALLLAEAAAGAIGGSMAGVEIAWEAGAPVVWDIDSVPEYRHAVPLATVRGQSVAAAIAAAAVRLAAGVRTARARVAGVQIGFGEPHWGRDGREVRDGVVLSA